MAFRNRNFNHPEGMPVDYNQPDFSKGDYFCKLCNSHMNCEAMWQTHVIGKRHLSNVKKAPGETLSKIKFVPINAKPHILPELHETGALLVGLEFTSETRRADPQIQPFYNCYLCQGTYTTSAFIEHVLSLKHQLNYLRKVDANGMITLEAMNLKDYQLKPIVNEMCHEKLQVLGRGLMEVKVEKSHRDVILKNEPSNSERPYFPPFNRRPRPGGSSVWNAEPPYCYEPPPGPHFDPMGPMDVPPSRMKMEKLSSASSVSRPVSPSYSSSVSEHDQNFDLKRDIAFLGPTQHAAIIDSVVESIEKKNAESSGYDEDVAIMAKKCFQIKFASLIKSIHKDADPEQKKAIEFEFSEEGQKARLARKKKALHIPGVSRYSPD